MITKISGVISQIIPDPDRPNICFLVFKKKRKGKEHLIAITAYADFIKRKGIREKMNVYTHAIIQSHVELGNRVHTNIFLERISLHEFEENTDYRRPKKQQQKPPDTQEETLFNETELE